MAGLLTVPYYTVSYKKRFDRPSPPSWSLDARETGQNYMPVGTGDGHFVLSPVLLVSRVQDGGPSNLTIDIMYDNGKIGDYEQSKVKVTVKNFRCFCSKQALRYCSSAFNTPTVKFLITRNVEVTDENWLCSHRFLFCSPFTVSVTESYWIIKVSVRAGYHKTSSNNCLEGVLSFDVWKFCCLLFVTKEMKEHSHYKLAPNLKAYFYLSATLLVTRKHWPRPRVRGSPLWTGFTDRTTYEPVHGLPLRSPLRNTPKIMSKSCFQGEEIPMAKMKGSYLLFVAWF